MSEVNTDAVYKKIKKQNGEGVAKVIREAVLLDVPNIVHILEFAGDNSEEAKALIPYIRERYKAKTKSEIFVDKNPLELLSDAGYDAFVVENEAQKDSIKKYFRSGEELCTFSDPDRHKKFYMIHAIKRGADKIKPAANPMRQDEYGTSVISIQIAKEGGFISIKNRYNHTVNDPDATFSNYPDFIIPGLTNSLKQFFNVDFDVTESLLPNGFCVINDQIFKFNYRIWGRLPGTTESGYYGYGDGFYFYGDNVIKLNRDYEIMLENYVLNLRDGTLKDVIIHESDGPSEFEQKRYKNRQNTMKVLEKFFKGKNIKVTINPENKHEKIISADGVWVAKVIDGKMVELNLPGVKVVGDDFLDDARHLQKLYMPDLEKAGNMFLWNVYSITQVHLPNLKEVGYSFISSGALSQIELPSLKRCGGGFLEDNNFLTELCLPELQYASGREFLPKNCVLRRLDLPKLKKIPEWFLLKNTVLEYCNLPSVQKSDSKKLRHVRYVVAKNKLKSGLKRVFLPQKAQSYSK